MAARGWARRRRAAHGTRRRHEFDKAKNIAQAVSNKNGRAVFGSAIFISLDETGSALPGLYSIVGAEAQQAGSEKNHRGGFRDGAGTVNEALASFQGETLNMDSDSKAGVTYCSEHIEIWSKCYG